MREVAPGADAQAKPGWFRDPMRKCVARAAYAEIAMAADDWSYLGLSRCLDPHADYDIDTLAEKLRKLRDGTRAPTLESWAFVAEAFPQVNLRRWIEHPLFLLLNPPKQSVQIGEQGADIADYAKVRRALDMVEGEIRDYLWLQPVELEAGTGTDLQQFSKYEYAQLIESSAFQELDWSLRLTVMTALAKLGKSRGNRALCQNACRWTRDNFGRAVAVTPQLLVGWIWLRDLFEAQLWSVYRPSAHRFDFFAGPVSQDEIEAMVRTAEWHRDRFGAFDALPHGERIDPPLRYVSHDFLRKV